MKQSSSNGSSELILQVQNLGKVYARKMDDVRKRLGRAVWRAFFHLPPPPTIDLKGTQFWAVQDVSFELRRGEAIGVIGLNGSGKTTLLRMLAGQIHPDAGEVVVQGSTAAMIDLQAGFQALANGQENIFLRAAALGFTRAQTAAHLDEIIEFSELGDAIQAPIATYSAGMRMRLAFSIMAIVSPDILFIDEVLAVGDFRFRQKCLAKVRQMRERSAFVFVSHSMGDVSRFCDRIIVMHKGRVHFEGPPDEAIKIYESLESDSPLPVDQKLKAAMGPVFENETALSEVEHFWCDRQGDPIDQTPFDKAYALRIKFRSNIEVKNLIIGIPVWAHNTHYTTGLSTQISSAPKRVRNGEFIDIMLEIETGLLNPGTIKSMLSILDGAEFLYRKENPDLQIHSARHPTWGAVTIPHTWKRLNAPAPTNPTRRSKSAFKP